MASGFREFFNAVGEITFLTIASFREMFKGPFEWKLIIQQLELGGFDSWTVTVLAAGFTGMVLSLQFAIGSEPFGASLYTAKLVAVGIVRELGPVLTALLVGGRVGSGYTAEIGSMNVTEQNVHKTSQNFLGFLVADTPTCDDSHCGSPTLRNFKKSCLCNIGI